MSAGFDRTKFHECENFLVVLSVPNEHQSVTTYFERVGFCVDEEGEFAFLPRDSQPSPWQSSDVTQVDFLFNGRPSNYAEPIDSVNFSCLVATLPPDTLPRFIEAVENFGKEFAGKIWHRNQPIEQGQIAIQLGKYVDELRAELGDAPGSEFVARMLQEFRPFQ